MKILRLCFIAVLSILSLQNLKAGVPVEDIQEEYKDFPLITYPNSIEEAKEDESFSNYAIICVPSEMEKEYLVAFPELSEKYRIVHVTHVDPHFEGLKMHISLYGVFIYYMQFVPLYETLGCAEFDSNQVLFVKNGFWARFCFDEQSVRIRQLTNSHPWGATIMPEIFFNGIPAVTDTGYGAIYQFYNDLDLSVEWPSYLDIPQDEVNTILEDTDDGNVKVFNISGQFIGETKNSEVNNLLHKSEKSTYIINDGKGRSNKIIK